MASFYRQIDESTFESLPATAGPWSAQSQHAGPPAAVARAWRIRRAPEDFPRLNGHRADRIEPVPVASDDARLQIPGAHADGYLSAVEWRFVAGGLGTGLQTMVAQISG